MDPSDAKEVARRVAEEVFGAPGEGSHEVSVPGYLRQELRRCGQGPGKLQHAEFIEIQIARQSVAFGEKPYEFQIVGSFQCRIGNAHVGTMFPV